ncbi:polysaccharide deacetylase family protein [Mucilaginibacter sp. AW1-3]
MLNFKNVNILFICLLGVGIWAGMPIYADVVLLAIYLSLLFYGCYYVGSNYFIPVICSVKTNEKIIALSFDDGPDAINTPQILAMLKASDVKAAFFCIGNKIADNKQVLKQIDDEGHIIANHSFSHHFWFDLFSTKKMTGDLLMMSEAMSNAIGKAPKLFRPPYGVTNPNVKNAINNCNYTPIGWSVRSMDTVIKQPEKLLSNMVSKIKPGAVFLFHDTSNTTLAMLPEFIQHIKAKGYQIVRLDKMLNLQAYA